MLGNVNVSLLVLIFTKLWQNTVTQCHSQFWRTWPHRLRCPVDPACWLPRRCSLFMEFSRIVSDCQAVFDDAMQLTLRRSLWLFATWTD